MSGVKIELKGYDELLKALDRIDDTLSFKLGKDMVKSAAAIVATKARQLAPEGDPQHHPDLIPLHETIAVEQHYYDGGKRALAIVGPIYSPTGGGGNHGHLVEFGHDIVARGQAKSVGRGRIKGAKSKGGVAKGRVAPRPFLRPAFDSTKGEQMAAMEKVMNQAIRDLGGG